MASGSPGDSDGTPDQSFMSIELSTFLRTTDNWSGQEKYPRYAEDKCSLKHSLKCVDYIVLLSPIFEAPILPFMIHQKFSFQSLQSMFDVGEYFSMSQRLCYPYGAGISCTCDARKRILRCVPVLDSLQAARGNREDRPGASNSQVQSPLTSRCSKFNF